MARITVTKEARKDLEQIRNYIRDELLNPSAAQRIIQELKKSIRSLETFPG
jgi:plasmid stabilization system protein ParE